MNGRSIIIGELSEWIRRKGQENGDVTGAYENKNKKTASS